MRWCLQRGFAMLLLVAASLGHAIAADTITLVDGADKFEVTGPVLTWLEAQNTSSIEVAAASIGKYEEHEPLHRYQLRAGDTLWVKLRMQLPSGSTDHWTLNIPQPSIDCVVLYQPDGKGGWTQQVAGDTHAQSEWTRKALHSDFDINIHPGTPQDVYLRVRNFKHLSMPILIATSGQRDVDRLREYVYLGLILGLLLALSMLSLIRFLEDRNRADAWASAYGLLITVTIAQINGIANALWWGNFPDFGDVASGILPLAAMGATLLFIRHLFGMSARYRRYDLFLTWAGWGSLAAISCYFLLDRKLADTIGAAFMFMAMTSCVAANFLHWRGGSVVARWLMIAFVPQFLMLMWMVAEALGLVTTVWEMRYVVSATLAFTVPLIVHALSIVTHDRKELRARHQALPTQDALTGILTPEAFEKAMQEARTRVVEEHDPVAFLLVDVINHEHIRETMGDQTAEQCLLRAVVKLHRVLRDVDQAGRVGSARFALLLEGVRTRQEVTERMVKLIASGLIPLKNLYPEVTLQFHIAAALLHERPLPMAEAMTELDEVLGSMSPRTRRPIRFLEPEATMAVPLDVMA